MDTLPPRLHAVMRYLYIYGRDGRYIDKRPGKERRTLRELADKGFIVGYRQRVTPHRRPVKQEYSMFFVGITPLGADYIRERFWAQNPTVSDESLRHPNYRRVELGDEERGYTYVVTPEGRKPVPTGSVLAPLASQGSAWAYLPKPPTVAWR